MAKYKFNQLLDGLSLGAGLNYVSKRNTFITDFSVPGYTTIDAMVGYKYRGASISVNLYNLTNTDYIYGVYSPANMWFGNPTSFRLTLGYIL